MADLKMWNAWTIADLSTGEFRLILKALGGRLTEEEAEEARALGDKLTGQRVSFTKQAHHEADKLLANLEAAGKSGVAVGC